MKCGMVPSAPSDATRSSFASPLSISFFSLRVSFLLGRVLFLLGGISRLRCLCSGPALPFELLELRRSSRRPGGGGIAGCVESIHFSTSCSYQHRRRAWGSLNGPRLRCLYFLLVANVRIDVGVLPISLERSSMKRMRTGVALCSWRARTIGGPVRASGISGMCIKRPAPCVMRLARLDADCPAFAGAGRHPDQRRGRRRGGSLVLRGSKEPGSTGKAVRPFRPRPGGNFGFEAQASGPVFQRTRTTASSGRVKSIWPATVLDKPMPRVCWARRHGSSNTAQAS